MQDDEIAEKVYQLPHRNSVNFKCGIKFNLCSAREKRKDYQNSYL